MLTFLIFPFVLFFIGALLVIGLPVAQSLQSYYKNLGLQPAICPDSGETVEVEMDSQFAFWAALRGQEHSRLKSCSRWPEKAECGQECQAQLDPSPENVERLLTKWYDGKSCAICARTLSPLDWQRSRLGVLNQEHELIELRDMQLDELQQTLPPMRPLCWDCHQEERVRQAVPPRSFKGDRHLVAPAI